MKLDRILIGMDFSPPAIAGAKWISDHFAPDAELTLLHVIEPPDQPRYAGWLLPPESTVEALAREDAEMRMREVGSYLTASEPRVEIRVGTPHEVIVTVARERGFDVVVIGPHAGGPRRWRFLGTTADRVVRTSSVPVLVATDPPAGPPLNFLVPVDERAVMPLVLDATRGLAERFDAAVTLLHVWSNAVYSHVASMSYATAHGDEQSARGDIAREMNEASEHWLNEVAHAGIVRERLTAMVKYGHAGDAIIETAGSMHADLVVLGRATASIVRPALLGSTIGTVLHGARCPLLIVAEEPAAAGG